jgi:hypothetical protein
MDTAPFPQIIESSSIPPTELDFQMQRVTGTEMKENIIQVIFILTRWVC